MPTASGNPEDQSHGDSPERAAEHQSHDLPSIRPERHAQTDLARAARHRIGRDAVQSDRGQHQGDRRRRDRQGWRPLAAASKVRADLILERADVDHRRGWDRPRRAPAPLAAPASPGRCRSRGAVRRRRATRFRRASSSRCRTSPSAPAARRTSGVRDDRAAKAANRASPTTPTMRNELTFSGRLSPKC